LAIPARIEPTLDTPAPVRAPEPEISLNVQVGKKEQVDERLLELFQNRSELKKEFAELRAERDRLVELVAEQKGITEREQAKMRALEKRLADPEMGYTALVYYHLRNLWDACHEQLVRFKEELVKQQEGRERKRLVMEFNQQREQRLQALTTRVQAVRAESDALKAQVLALEGQMLALTGFWNYFKRRALAPELDQRRLEHETVREQVDRLLDQRIAIEGEPWPEPKGLGIGLLRAAAVIGTAPGDPGPAAAVCVEPVRRVCAHRVDTARLVSRHGVDDLLALAQAHGGDPAGAPVQRSDRPALAEEPHPPLPVRCHRDQAVVLRQV